MKEVTQDKGMPPGNGAAEMAKTNANKPAPQGIFDYSVVDAEDKDRVDRLKNGHDKGNYSNYYGSL